jgi:3-hydroxyacyl-CoA dehydrogenase/enoyl-CoA hydratase/3-hydroxybutyryl-CoA epimerase
MSEMISIRQAENGISIVVLDAKGDKVNTLSPALGDELDPAMERLGGDTTCAGIVLISGKADSFIVGADIKQLATLRRAEEGARLSRHAQHLLDRLAAMRIPVVAAIHGPCLGGGLELALACHGRVCSDDRSTKLGFPEIQLGLIPGAGGTQRAPRLVGVQAALDMILTAKNISPAKAKKMGLVDEVVPKSHLEQSAMALVRKLAQEKKQQEDRNLLEVQLAELRSLLDGRELTERLLGSNALGRRFVFRKAGAMVQSKTRGNYPALPAALRAIEAGLAGGMKKGLEVESQEFGQLIVSDVSRRLVELFFATQTMKRETGVSDTAVQPATITRLGILGGGLMGAGIAYVAAHQGVHVRMKEQDPGRAAASLKSVRELVKPRFKRKGLTSSEEEKILARISATADYSGFRHADLIIEAVFEDLSLKQGLLREIEPMISERCIFASNTSSLPISQIAAAAQRPEMVLGMHFFSPVQKMPLLEIIVTDKTAAQATATSVEFGKKLNKQVIVVKDGVGFYTSRILAPYLNEAAHVLSEGGAIEDIDRAMMDFGFPVGPMALMDEVGIDVAAKVAQIMYQAFGQRMKPVKALEGILAEQRYGRKNKRGFYLYGEKKKGKKLVDESVYACLAGGKRRQSINPQEVQKRLSLQMINEAMHCLGEGILRCPRDGDIGAIFGLGFPPFWGGPFRYVDSQGAEKLLGEMERLKDHWGVRFEPAPLLVEAAKDHRQFHD